MIKRIFWLFFISAFIIIAASLTLIVGALYNYFSGVHYDSLQEQTRIIAYGIEQNGVSFVENMETKGYNIMLIGPDGDIIYDSTNDDIDKNEREAFLVAKREGFGAGMRILPYLTEKNIYSAYRLEDGRVVLITERQYTFFSPMMGFIQLVAVIAVVAMILSVLLAYVLSTRIVKPLNNIDLDSPKSGKNYKELLPMLDRIETQQSELRDKDVQLKNRRIEFETAADNMSEGLILLDSGGNIISVNKAASAILDMDRSKVGELSFSGHEELGVLVSSALSGESDELFLAICDEDYRVNASPVISDGKTVGAVLFMFDITEHEKSELMRREFTSNVTHELKTPLQSISGYAELIMSGIAKKEDVPVFGERIYTESQRVTALIDDVIKLSKLDEGAIDMQRSDIELLGAARDEARMLADNADEMGVDVNVSGDSVVINAFPALVRAIFHNLCENAIKYNRENGSVDIIVKDDGDSAVITVSDTGIGIPPEHIDRVFERFYRVDKSRSKELGGTGLGLAIVKHAAKILDADVNIDSVPDKGTTITVVFPKKSV